MLALIIEFKKEFSMNNRKAFLIIGENNALKRDLLTRMLSKLESGKNTTLVSECIADRTSKSYLSSAMRKFSYSKLSYTGATLLMNAEVKGMQAEIFNMTDEGRHQNYIFLMSPEVSQKMLEDMEDFIIALDTWGQNLLILNTLNAHDSAQDEIAEFELTDVSRLGTETYHFSSGSIKQAQNNPIDSNYIVIPKLAKNVINALDLDNDHLLFNAIGELNHFQDIQLGSHLGYLEDQGFWDIFEDSKM